RHDTRDGSSSREQALTGHLALVNTVLTTPDGVPHGAGLPRPDAAPITLPHIAEVAHTGRAVISNLTQGPLSGKPTIIFAYPVRNDQGATAAVLGIGVHLQRLQQVFAAVPLPDGSVITLSDRTSRVLPRSREAQRFTGPLLNLDASEPKNAPTVATSSGADGIVRIYGNTVVARGPWLLSVGIPQRVALERLTPLWVR